MPNDGQPVRLRPRWTDSLRPHLLLPSWLLSLALHAVVLFLFLFVFQGFGSGPGGEGAGEEFRELGIYVKQTGQATEPDESVAQSTETVDAAVSDPTDSLDEPLTLPDEPPVELTDPQKEPQQRIGSGQAISPRSSANQAARTSSGQAADQSPRSGGSRSENKIFFGARDTGTQFVYLIDNSASMSKNDALRVAKAELMASLQSLDRSQQFQIIFYNLQTTEMLDRSGKPALLRATDVNRNLASRFIAGIEPNRGTDHLPALLKAVRYRSDVIFFLTDGADPPLSGGELQKIKSLNGGRTRIHCIEFGVGAELSVDNFLKTLARQNGGTYHYRDITKLRSFATSRVESDADR